MTAAPLKFHRFADIFPPMDDEAFEALVADIKAFGQRDAITLYQGQILEGRHRYRACQRLKIKPKFEEFEGTDEEATAFVFSKNFHRRHLSAEDRRKALVAIVAARAGMSDRAIAREAGVHHSAIGRARKAGEATGAVAPVGKRKGADGKTRRKPAAKGKAGKSAEGALVWARNASSRESEAITSGGRYSVGKRDVDVYVAMFYPKNKAPVSFAKGVSLKSLKEAKAAAQADYDKGATAPAPAAEPGRSDILAADERWAAEMSASNAEAARRLYDLLSDEERRAAFVAALGKAIGVDVLHGAIGAAGNDADPAASAARQRARLRLAEEDAEDDERPRRRGPKVNETTLGEAVSTAFEELTGLGSECRDVVDNTPEGLSQTGRIQALDATAEILEGLEFPDVPAELSEIKVTFKRSSAKNQSRQEQANEALAVLLACREALEEIKEGDPRHQAAVDLSSELDVESEVNECEFPGMYG